VPGPAILSILALLVAIAISCVLPINVGLLAIAFAYLVGHGVNVAAGFPVNLFLTLVGTMFLFSLAAANGTLDQAARRSIVLARGNKGLIPIVFFVLAVVRGAAGPGGIAAAALLAPVAMAVAAELNISAFLMTLMVANGANAGTFSPIAPTGIIARDLMSRIGLAGMEWPNFWNTLLAQSAVAFAGYLALGGASLLLQKSAVAHAKQPPQPLERRQKLTLALILGLVAAVMVFRVDIGVAAFVTAAVVSLARLSDEDAALRRMPWGVILMVCGVTMLIGVMERTGGMALFTGFLKSFTQPAYLPGVIAFVTGLISVYSSSSGVVMPAFLPMVPGLGGNDLMVAYAVNVGSHLVDVSPLSTIGAICIAAAPVTEDRNLLFRKLLIWGWSMAFVGAVVCQMFFGYR